MHTEKGPHYCMQITPAAKKFMINGSGIIFVPPAISYMLNRLSTYSMEVLLVAKYCNMNRLTM